MVIVFGLRLLHEFFKDLELRAKNFRSGWAADRIVWLNLLDSLLGHVKAFDRRQVRSSALRNLLVRRVFFGILKYGFLASFLFLQNFGVLTLFMKHVFFSR